MSLIEATAGRVSGWLGRESRLVRALRPTYENFLNLWTAGRGVAWEINGETYRIDPRQRRQLGHDYDASVAAFIRERIKPDALCIDVGANVGVYVMQFARWTGKEGRVIAFEPNPGALAYLRRHVEMNGLAGRAEIVAAAVGAESGRAKMFAAGADGMSRLGAPNDLIASETREIEVPVVTLDEFCEEHDVAPDWLFIDIEGFELAALEGARRLIERRGAALNIIVEMHPDVWETANASRADAERLLEEMGLRAVPLTGQRDALGEYGLVFLEGAKGAS